MQDLAYCVNFCDNKYTLTAKKERSVLVLACLSWKYLEISESVESTLTKKYGPVRAVSSHHYLSAIFQRVLKQEQIECSVRRFYARRHEARGCNLVLTRSFAFALSLASTFIVLSSSLRFLLVSLSIFSSFVLVDLFVLAC